MTYLRIVTAQATPVYDAKRATERRPAVGTQDSLKGDSVPLGCIRQEPCANRCTVEPPH